MDSPNEVAPLLPADPNPFQSDDKKGKEVDYLISKPVMKPRGHRRLFVSVFVAVIVFLLGLVFLRQPRNSSEESGDDSEIADIALLSITVRNPDYTGYNNLTKYPWLGEGYGVLIEPYRVSTLRVVEPLDGATYTWQVGTATKPTLRLDDVSPTVETFVGVDLNEISVGINVTGAYSLTVLEEFAGATLGRATLNLYVKYVRRELRELTLRDREEFLDAAATLWRVSTKKGRLEFGWGEAYRDINTLAIIHNDLAGNVICDHLHGTIGYNFLAGHVALGNMLEQSLQAVNPRVSLAYWDYTSEVAGCKSEDAPCFWDVWGSALFTEDFFGSKGERGRIGDGRWKDIQVPIVDAAFFDESMIDGHYKDHSYAGCYAQSSTNAGCDIMGRKEFRARPGTPDVRYVDADKHIENAFGLLRSPWNINADRYVVRSGDMCGIRNDQQWPDCNSVISQQERYDTFASWVLEMQFSPHGSTHLFIGGAFGECSTMLPRLKDKLSYSTYHRIVSKAPDLLKNLHWFNFLTCPDRDSCELIKNESAYNEGCRCECPAIANLTAANVDHEAIEQVQAYFYILSYLSPAMKKEVQALPPPEKLFLLQMVCNSNIMLGDMLTSNSPLDITFFVIHAEVERIWQRKALSGTVTDLEWPYPPGYSKWDPPCPAQCPGYTTTWMKYNFDGKAGAIGKQDYSYSTSLRNDVYLQHLTPFRQIYAEAIPYVYDKFRWEACSIPKNKRSYMDKSLMNSSAWIHPHALKWLQDL